MTMKRRDEPVQAGAREGRVTRPIRGAKAPGRPVVTAAFAMSWDGRVMEQLAPAEPVDAELHEAEAAHKSYRPYKSYGGMRVLLSTTGRIRTGAGFFLEKASQVMVYSTDRMPGTTQRALAGMQHVRVHLRAEGWPIREVLEHLRATHGVRRVGIAGGPKLLRELAAGGLLDELCLAWRPMILGGKFAPAITGLEEGFLPRGIVLDLLKLERKDDGCRVRYRVHAAQP